MQVRDMLDIKVQGRALEPNIVRETTLVGILHVFSGNPSQVPTETCRAVSRYK